jgi:adenosylcobinamide-phosphate synthase
MTEPGATLGALAAGAAPGAALMLLMALALDAVAGEARGPLRRLPHPVRAMGALISALDRRLNRDTRTECDRRLRGVLTVFVVGAAFGGGAWLLVRLLASVPFGWLVELLLVTSLLAQRSLDRHVHAVLRALSDRGLAAGRGAVARIVGRDVSVLDRHGVARAAIESCAENFSDGVVAPALWYLVLGLPGMVAYKAVNTMDSMIGHRTPRYRAYGWAAARLDDGLNLVPARLSSLLVAAAALALPGASPRAALRIVRRDARRHRSPNAGWPEAAMAGALGLALSGPRRYGDGIVDEPWLGCGRARAEAADIARALVLYRVACLLTAVPVAAMAAIGPVAG